MKTQIFNNTYALVTVAISRSLSALTAGDSFFGEVTASSLAGTTSRLESDSSAGGRPT